MTLVRGTPRQGLWGATLGFLVGFAAVALFGPTGATFREVMHLSPLLTGLLVAMPALSGSLLRIPFAAWVDTTGGRKPFLVLLLLSIAGMTGLSAVVWLLYPDHLTAGLYPVLLILALLCGCGIATFSVGIGQVSYWYSQSQQGRALGTYAGVGNLAPGVFSLLLALVLPSWGLAGAYLAWLLFLGLGTLLYAVLGRNAWYFQLLSHGVPHLEARRHAQGFGQELFPAGSLRTSLSLSARTWRTWALVGVYFTTFGGFIALTAWLPTYWTGAFATGTFVAGALTALYSILASLVRIAGGAIADRAGGEGAAAASLAVVLAGAAILTLSQSFPAAITGIVLMAVGMGVANAAVFKLVPREVPHAVGGAAGWVGGLGAFGGFVIPPLMGWFVTQWGQAGYRAGFVVFLALPLVSLGLVALIASRRRTPVEPVKEHIMKPLPPNSGTPAQIVTTNHVERTLP